MMPKHVLYIVSQVQKSLGFEWTAKGLNENYKLTFVLLNPSSSPLEDFLVAHGVTVKRITYRGKGDFLIAILKTFFFLMSNRPNVVHAHLLDAQLIGLTCAWLLRIKKRIYTRHNSNFHHVYEPSGVKYDRWSNRLATQIVSISQATDKVLLDWENVSPTKIVKIPHGFDWNEFIDVPAERTQAIRTKWNLPASQRVVGVIARHIEWKGIQYIIPAFKNFLAIRPDACLVLANASGPYHEEISKMLKDIPHGKVIEIPFEEDVAALYQTFEWYVHTPVDAICEAFGQTYVESLAAGVPAVFTASGIATEFIENKKNAIVVGFQNSEEIYQGLVTLSENKELRHQLIENGKRDVISRFGIDVMLSSLKKLYDA